ncbi:MAG: hypothetical protein QXT73_05430 [Candidatus Methanomethylicaceae archaeon]
MSTYDALRKFAPDASQIVRYVYFKSLARAEQELSPIKYKLAPLGEIGRGFFDAIKGVYVAAKERDKASLFMKLYRHGDPKGILELAEKFKNEAFRSTIDDYERGFLICWEIMLATLSSLKQEYPDYPLKDEQQQQQPSQSKTEEEVYEVAPRKKAKNKDKSKSKNTKG